MVVTLEKHRIAYFGVPKAAGTSIYLAFYQAQNGHPWPGPEMEIHKLFNTLPAPPGSFEKLRSYWKFTVIRDPVQRVLSAYQNRVADLGDLERVFGSTLRARLGAWRRRLKPRPTASEFFERHEDYVRYSHSLRHHTRSITAYVGSDLAYFDAVYTIRDLEQLALELTRRLGVEVQFPRGNSSKGSLRFEDLSATAQAKVLEITRSDYAFLADYFTPPTPLPARAEPPQPADVRRKGGNP